MRRVSVIGTSGSGKTTMARALGGALDHPVLELDSVHHQPDWEPLPEAEFRARLLAFLDANDRWIVDGNYTSHGVAELVWPRADTIVWMDPPRSVVMAQVLQRTLVRGVRRRELWNGNVEDWRSMFRTDPEENIVLWAWTTFDRNRRRYESRLESDEWRHLVVHRIRSRAEARRLVPDSRSGDQWSG